MNLRSPLVWASLFAMAIAPTRADAQSLRDLRAQESEEGAMAREVAYTSEVCGRRISARLDWASAGGWPAETSLVQACDGALGAVEAQCRSGRKITVMTFVCAGDGSGPSLSGGVLRYGASPDGNAFDETTKYLAGGE